MKIQHIALVVAAQSLMIVALCIYFIVGLHKLSEADAKLNEL